MEYLLATKRAGDVGVNVQHWCLLRGLAVQEVELGPLQ